MRLFSYVVTRDYGFAPNPFYGVCTLATCKPVIRRVAIPGDWIVGISSLSDGQPQRIVFVMQVGEAMTFDSYWRSPRFRRKRPYLRGSLKQAYGDNIYRRDPMGSWLQEDSHHSHEGGVVNLNNLRTDTNVDRVLVGPEFAYWGACGPPIPEMVGGFPGSLLCVKRAHRSRFPDEFVRAFVGWFRSLDAWGYLGNPGNWGRSL